MRVSKPENEKKPILSIVKSCKNKTAQSSCCNGQNLVIFIPYVTDFLNLARVVDYFFPHRDLHCS